MTDIYIGIDPGTHTGIAVWSSKERKLLSVETKGMYEASEDILFLAERYGPDNILVRFEDARKRNWFGNSGREQLQGAGSIKRDCSLWEEFLTSKGIPFVSVAPKANRTKMKPEVFAKYTGWAKRTSEHARDAAMLVFGLISNVNIVN